MSEEREAGESMVDGVVGRKRGWMENGRGRCGKRGWLDREW